MRRGWLYKKARELGCNKMALGHHLDDMIQTLLMNMTFQGSYSTMPPLLKMDKFDMCIIRPLSLVEEKDLIQYALHKGYKKQPHNCLYETDSNRTSIREVLDKMIQLNPHAKSSLLRSMMNVQDNYLPKSVK